MRGQKIWHLYFQLQTAPLSTTPDTYTDREIIAYNIEYAVKFAYPVAFVCFNIIYWVIYMEKFNEEIMNDWNKIYLFQKIPKKKLFLNPLNDFYVKTTELIVEKIFLNDLFLVGFPSEMRWYNFYDLFENFQLAIFAFCAWDFFDIWQKKPSQK